MTMVTLDLAKLSEDDLGLVFRLDSEEAIAAALAEADQREARQAQASAAETQARPRDSRAARQARERVSGATSAWYEAAHAQYLAAETACRGHLLSTAGERATSEPMTLWTGGEAWARRMASEELRAFWDENGGRLTLTRYRDGLAASRRDEREAASREDHDSRVKDRDGDMDILAGQALNGEAGAPPGDPVPWVLPGLAEFARPPAPVSLEDEAAAMIAAGPEAAPEPPGELGGVTCLAAVPERPVVPLDLGGIPLVIPRADVALMFGQGAIGKGRMTWAIIAAVTRAGGDVIVIMPEDKEDEAMAERGRAAGADMARVWNLTRLPGSAERFKLSAAERHEGHIGHLRGFVETLREHGRRPLLVVIDPISAVVGWGTMLTVAGARRLVEPLQDMADETGVAVLAIGHTTKDGKLAGSAGLSQALRLVYRVAVDPVNTAYRIITVEKANNLPPGIDGLRFTITAGEDGRPRVEWLDKAAIERQRTSWRDEVPAAHAPTSLPAAGQPASPAAALAVPAGPFAAAWSVRHPGQAPQVHPIQGVWASLEAAQGICQATARRALTWQPSTRRPGAWRAVTYPSGPDGPEVSYAVSAANGRQS